MTCSTRSIGLTASTPCLTIAARCRTMGFEYCALRHAASGAGHQSEDHHAQRSYPTLWQQRYAFRRNYLDVDPTVQLGRCRSNLSSGRRVFATTPELWDDARDAGACRLGGEVNAGGAERRRHADAIENFYEPLTDKGTGCEEHRMRWLAQTAHQGSKGAGSGTSLSIREKCCAGRPMARPSPRSPQSWTSLWPRSVPYTRNAAEKLGTVNRTAAVARAVAMGLLF